MSLDALCSCAPANAQLEQGFGVKAGAAVERTLPTCPAAESATRIRRSSVVLVPLGACIWRPQPIGPIAAPHRLGCVRLLEKGFCQAFDHPSTSLLYAPGLEQRDRDRATLFQAINHVDWTLLYRTSLPRRGRRARRLASLTAGFLCASHRPTACRLRRRCCSTTGRDRRDEA